MSSPTARLFTRDVVVAMRHGPRRDSLPQAPAEANPPLLAGPDGAGLIVPYVNEHLGPALWRSVLNAADDAFDRGVEEPTPRHPMKVRVRLDMRVSPFQRTVETAKAVASTLFETLRRLADLSMSLDPRVTYDIPAASIPLHADNTLCEVFGPSRIKGWVAYADEQEPADPAAAITPEQLNQQLDEAVKQLGGGGAEAHTLRQGRPSWGEQAHGALLRFRGALTPAFDSIQDMTFTTASGGDDANASMGEEPDVLVRIRLLVTHGDGVGAMSDSLGGLVIEVRDLGLVSFVRDSRAPVTRRADMWSYGIERMEDDAGSLGTQVVPAYVNSTRLVALFNDAVAKGVRLMSPDVTPSQTPSKPLRVLANSADSNGGHGSSVRGGGAPSDPLRLSPSTLTREDSHGHLDSHHGSMRSTIMSPGRGNGASLVSNTTSIAFFPDASGQSQPGTNRLSQRSIDFISDDDDENGNTDDLRTAGSAAAAAQPESANFVRDGESPLAPTMLLEPVVGATRSTVASAAGDRVTKAVPMAHLAPQERTTTVSPEQLGSRAPSGALLRPSSGARSSMGFQSCRSHTSSVDNNSDNDDEHPRSYRNSAAPAVDVTAPPIADGGEDRVSERSHPQQPQSPNSAMPASRRASQPGAAASQTPRTVTAAAPTRLASRSRSPQNGHGDPNHLQALANNNRPRWNHNSFVPRHAADDAEPQQGADDQETRRTVLLSEAQREALYQRLFTQGSRRSTVSRVTTTHGPSRSNSPGNNYQGGPTGTTGAAGGEHTGTVTAQQLFTRGRSPVREPWRYSRPRSTSRDPVVPAPELPGAVARARSASKERRTGSPVWDLLYLQARSQQRRLNEAREASEKKREEAVRRALSPRPNAGASMYNATNAKDKEEAARKIVAALRADPTSADADPLLPKYRRKISKEELEQKVARLAIVPKKSPPKKYGPLSEEQFSFVPAISQTSQRLAARARSRSPSVKTTAHSVAPTDPGVPSVSPALETCERLYQDAEKFRSHQQGTARSLFLREASKQFAAHTDANPHFKERMEMLYGLDAAKRKYTNAAAQRILIERTTAVDSQTLVLHKGVFMGASVGIGRDSYLPHPGHHQQQRSVSPSASSGRRRQERSALTSADAPHWKDGVAATTISSQDRRYSEAELRERRHSEPQRVGSFSRS
jgi:hypothetical protein